jgi:mono/diheme cytochrome c family protein
MKKAAKILFYIAAAFAGIVVIALAFVFLGSRAALRKEFHVTVRPVAIPTGADALARGRHLAETRGCNDCHGADFGGGKVIDDGAMGRIHAPNLTRGRGSRIAAFTDEDWVRAIRHGIGPDGRGLIVMPSLEYSQLSDEDLGELIAYLKTVPAVDRERTPASYGPVTRVLLTLSPEKMISANAIDHAHAGPPAVAKGPTVAYGKYLSAGCIGCHGANLSGGKIDVGPPDWPLAANLTPHPTSRLAKWSEQDFISVVRTGVRPDGSAVNPVMPRVFGQMDDVELKALYAFLRSLPPVAQGVR